MAKERTRSQSGSRTELKREKSADVIRNNPPDRRQILNGDITKYGGSGQGNLEGIEADKILWHGCPYSMEITYHHWQWCALRAGDRRRE